MDNLPKGYTCRHCGAFSKFSSWLYAHWNESVIHTCECGAREALLRGQGVEHFPPREFHTARGIMLDIFGQRYHTCRDGIESDESYRNRILTKLKGPQ